MGNNDHRQATLNGPEGSTYICKDAAVNIRETLIKVDDINDCINIAKSSLKNLNQIDFNGTHCDIYEAEND